MRNTAEEREKEIVSFELRLGVEFPQSYRRFLLEHGSAVIAGYQILGIPERKQESEKPEEERLDLNQIAESPSCPVCQRQKQIGRITCYNCYNRYSREINRQTPLSLWVKEKLSFQKKQEEEQKKKTEKKELSVLDATQTLWRLRKDIAEKKLIPISFKKSRLDNKDKALCFDLSQRDEKNEDAPLVEVSDINQEGAPVYSHSNSFREWLEHLGKMEERSKIFQVARQRIKNRKNEIRERIIRREIEQRFGFKCPVCQKEERGEHLVCSQCFNNWRKETQQEIDLVEWICEKLETKGYNFPKFTHIGGKEVRRIYSRPQDWHNRIFRVRDYVVGLMAFRYRAQLACLEVDVFWSGDLTGYVEGQAIRNLAIAVFSEAHSLTGSLNLAFTKDIREDEKTGKIVERDQQKILPNLLPELQKEAEKQRGRVHRAIPQELIELAKEYGINFSQVEQGRISHQEGLQLFWALLEWPERLQKRVDDLEETGYLTKQALASVIYSGIWSKEEAIWLFENASRPEAIILGSDVPENRLYYTESMHYGRAAYLANLLGVKISTDLAGGFSPEERETDCFLEPQGRFWVLRANKKFYLPWMIKGSEPVLAKPNESILILSVPCQTTQPDYDKTWIQKNIEVLRNAESEIKTRCLLLGFEFSDLKYGMKVSEEMKEISRGIAQKGVYLLFSPFRLALLDDEVENKMNRARKMRHFPSRSVPLKLQVIEIPETRWQKPDLLYSVEDVQSAASWIKKKISQRLGRIRFRVNCQCIERIALQYSGNETTVKLSNGQKILEKWRAQVYPASQKGEYHLKMAWHKIFTGLKENGRIKEEVKRMADEWDRIDMEKGTADWLKLPSRYQQEHRMLQLGEALRQFTERISPEVKEKKKVIPISAAKSQSVLKALKRENGITYPFVLPEALPSFLKRLSKKTRLIFENIQGGIVAVVPPYEKSAIETEIKPVEGAIKTSLVPPDFQFPVNPEKIDYSRYQQGHRQAEIKRFHEQIQEALRPDGQPLAVSYLPHELFPEVMRDYIYYRKKFLMHREPVESINLRIVYQDGTEGQPFPLFCLAEPEKIPRLTDLYQFKIGSISMRHVSLDLITEGYLIQNLMIKRKETSADQEDYAFRRTWHFLTNFVDLVQHKRVKEITQEIRFRYLWNLLNLKEKKYNGCELHIYQTGLEPAVVGIYRAVVEFLQERRGELVVVPRLIGRKEKKELRTREEIKESTDAAYLKAAEWF